MIRSETRGVARGTAPKRSRSERGPPVCIISMAQQASPNSMYQTDDLRVQLRTSSSFAVTRLSGTLLISDIVTSDPGRASARPGHSLEPLEVALHPDVDQAYEQDAHEDEQLRENQEPPALQDVLAKRDGDRIDERDLHIEDHENQRDQVETDVEVDPGAARRRLATLVRRQLPRLGIGRPQQHAETQHEPCGDATEKQENQHVGELKLHLDSVVRLRPA